MSDELRSALAPFERALSDVEATRQIRRMETHELIEEQRKAIDDGRPEHAREIGHQVIEAVRKAEREYAEQRRTVLSTLWQKARDS